MSDLKAAHLPCPLSFFTKLTQRPPKAGCHQHSTWSIALPFCTINSHCSHTQLYCKGHSVHLWFFAIFQLQNPPTPHPYPSLYEGSGWRSLKTLLTHLFVHKEEKKKKLEWLTSRRLSVLLPFLVTPRLWSVFGVSAGSHVCLPSEVGYLCNYL